MKKIMCICLVAIMLLTGLKDNNSFTGMEKSIKDTTQKNIKTAEETSDSNIEAALQLYNGEKYFDNDKIEERLKEEKELKNHIVWCVPTLSADTDVIRSEKLKKINDYLSHKYNYYMDILYVTDDAEGSYNKGILSYLDKKYADVYQNMFQIIDAVCMDDNMEELASQVDVIFTATPQGLCASLVNEEILSKTKIIDLSADFRLKDVKIYEEWYKLEHKSPQFIEEAVYGLCEVNREDVKKARLVANPGCYTTCSILTAYPLAKEGLIDMDTLIIDAKSGTSGAGRGAKLPNLYCEVNENIKAYGVATHRHTPEIEEQLGYASGKKVVLNFTPHLVPMNRGILVTEYAKLTKEVSYEDVKAVYDKYYGGEKFVRVLQKDVCPETKWVEGSNYVDIGFKIDPRTNRIIMMGAIDNLVKGAAGQAVQNMNLMFGLPESEGLELVPMFP